MKKKILIIVTFLTTMILISLASVYAVEYLYNSNEVYYDNTNSNLTSSDVQGAIDELYTEANTVKTQLTTCQNSLSTSQSSLSTCQSSLSASQTSLSTCQTKLSQYIDPTYIDFGTLVTNTKRTILASSSGICIKRNGKIGCMKPLNYEIEKNHIKEIFPDVSCTGTVTVTCSASDFSCGVNPAGMTLQVICTDRTDSSYCRITRTGIVSCT